MSRMQAAMLAIVGTIVMLVFVTCAAQFIGSHGGAP